MFQGMQQMSQTLNVWQNEARKKTTFELMAKKPNWGKILPFFTIAQIEEFFSDEDNYIFLGQYLKSVAKGKNLTSTGLRRFLSKDLHETCLWDTDTYYTNIPCIPLFFRNFYQAHMGEDPDFQNGSISIKEARLKIQRHFVQLRCRKCAREKELANDSPEFASSFPQSKFFPST